MSVSMIQDALHDSNRVLPYISNGSTGMGSCAPAPVANIPANLLSAGSLKRLASLPFFTAFRPCWAWAFPEAQHPNRRHFDRLHAFVCNIRTSWRQDPVIAMAMKNWTLPGQPAMLTLRIVTTLLRMVGTPTLLPESNFGD
jgi:hypothetical protein